MRDESDGNSLNVSAWLGFSLGDDGFLTLSLLAPMVNTSDCPNVAGIKMGVNYGSNHTRFLAPVRVGKRIRGVFKLLEMAEKRPGQWQQTMEVTVEIEGEDKPALICDWIALVFV